MREIKELTISRDKSLEEKSTLFDNKRDKWNSQEVQDEVKALNKKIADCDNEIRSNLNIVQNFRRENQYKANKKISNAMLNILDWFERYPDIVKNITRGLTIQRVSDWTINDINYLQGIDAYSSDTWYFLSQTSVTDV